MSTLTLTQLFDLALQHHQAGRLSEAEKLYRQILAQDPNQPDTLHLLGVLAAQCSKHELAIEVISKAIVIKSDAPEYHTNLGNALREMGRNREAAAAYRKVVELRPDSSTAHKDLGGALRDIGQIDEALQACREALRLQSDSAAAHNELGLTLLEIGHFDEALACARAAARLSPDWPDARFNLGISELLQGNFEQGWPGYEWRLHLKNFAAHRKDAAIPRWDGSPLNGRTLFIRTEQGMGDTIQFIRYIPLIPRDRGRIIINCRPELSRLLKSIPDLEHVPADTTPPCDVRCPLMSLPFVFGTRLDTIPTQVPYLKLDPELVESWGRKLGPSPGGARIGLVWAGLADHARDRHRSMTLEHYASLARLPNTTFYSLQKGPASAQATSPPAGMTLIDYTADLNDMADTAALVSQLDLVISIDSSVAHLSGAIGKPTWVLLPFFPDWRWLLEREDSPWYPTMRLFRQNASGDWNEVIKRVSVLLEANA